MYTNWLAEQGNSVFNKYAPAPNFEDDIHREHAIQILLEFYQYMTNKDIKMWPMFGTLLGIFRGDDLIPHDGDLDFGYLAEQQTDFLIALESLHNDNGYSVVRNHGYDLFSVHKDSVLIDLYRYDANKEKKILLQGPRGAYNILFDEAFPFGSISFRGRELNCIHNPKAFFERYYGHDWHTPRDYRN